MPHNTYMVRKRFKGDAMCGSVNLPYGTLVICSGGVICTKEGKPLCLDTSQNAYNYFSHNDDGQAALRANLVQSIMDALKNPVEGATQEIISQHQETWNRVWADSICNSCRRSEYEDFWIWNYDFYNAEISILRHINKLVGGKNYV